MRKRFGFMTFGVAAMLFFLSALVFAAAAPAAGVEKLSTKAGVLMPVEIMLPDLQVKDISLTKNCEFQVIIINIGRKGVLESCYGELGGLVIKVFKGDKLVDALNLKKFDPLGKLRTPGGTATHVWPTSKVPPDSVQAEKEFKVVVDAGNSLKETSKLNNMLTKKLFCLLKSSITITHIDPTLEDLICWYRPSPTGHFQCIIFWNTKNYFYPKIKKIALICKSGSQDGNNYHPCSTVYPIATDVPNSGEFHFDLPRTNEIGDFVLKIYGYGNIESPAYPICIW